MSESLLPDGLSRDLGRMLASSAEAARVGLIHVASRMEGLAKEHVKEGGSHRYGTQTPARRGSGPAVISGDLLRSITHTEIEFQGDLFVSRVGGSDVPHTSYASRGKRRSRSRSGRSATCGDIGGFVEKMGYPWLVPAFDEGVADTVGIGGQIFDAIEW